MIDKVVKFVSSLKLTVVCLAFALVLVFVGTLAQVKLGLYTVQELYFRSLLVWWSPEGASWKIPILPGGWLLGGVLLVNLVCAHAERFRLTRNKVGVFMVHAGLILLLLGQFLTEVFQVESSMRIEEGRSKNYSTASLLHELAVIDTSNTNYDEVISFPESYLAKKGEINHPKLPFKLQVKEYFPNSEPILPQAQVPGAISAPQGVGQKINVRRKEVTARLDDRNIPSATVEVLTPSGSKGVWLVSNWTGDDALVSVLKQNFGPRVAGLDAPQEFTVEGRTYQVSLRSTRYYKPYTIQLLDFTHDRYKGTDKPKNFSSKVRLENPATGENREVLIYMNNPLRYAGETYYQGGFERGDNVTILQVVRNPAWLTPYFSCTLVGVGLMVQFLMHLINFGKRSGGGGRGEAAKASKKSGSQSPMEPATATVAQTALPISAKRSSP